MLEVAVAIVGPPAAGKTTLSGLLAGQPDCGVFRLREYVSEAVLAATATSADRLGWIDEVSVARALDSFVETAVRKDELRVILLDNFPASASQVALLVSVLRKWAPACRVEAVELVADRTALERRIRDRRVCQQCEHDPIHDPRLPAAAGPADPGRCVRCSGVRHPRRDDAPRLVATRRQRYELAITDIRDTFHRLGLSQHRLDAERPPEQLASELSDLLTTRSCP
jgi:adenylate kinase